MTEEDKSNVKLVLIVLGAIAALAAIGTVGIAIYRKGINLGYKSGLNNGIEFGVNNMALNYGREIALLQGDTARAEFLRKNFDDNLGCTEPAYREYFYNVMRNADAQVMDITKTSANNAVQNGGTQL